MGRLLVTYFTEPFEAACVPNEEECPGWLAVSAVGAG